MNHIPTDHRLDYCLCGTSWLCPRADEPMSIWARLHGWFLGSDPSAQVAAATGVDTDDVRRVLRYVFTEQE